MPTVGAEQDWHKVRSVIDGDTLKLDNGQTIRLIGIDAPEVIDEHGRNIRTARWTSVAPTVINDYALRAKSMVEEWVHGQKVRLEFDPSNITIGHRDKYGRLLAYVYRDSDNSCLNAELISQGYALTYRRFDFKDRDQYLLLEKDAKDNSRGFWHFRK